MRKLLVAGLMPLAVTLLSAQSGAAQCGACWADDDYDGSGHTWHKNPAVEWGETTNPHGDYKRGACGGSYLDNHDPCGIMDEADLGLLGSIQAVGFDELMGLVAHNRGVLSLSVDSGLLVRSSCSPGRRRSVAVYELRPEIVRSLRAALANQQSPSRVRDRGQTFAAPGRTE